VNFLSLELWKHNVSMVVWNCFSTGSKPQQREAKAVAMLALKLLSSQFLELHPSFTEKVASVMADHLLVSQKTLKLNMMVLKLAGKMSFGLFQGLSEWNEETPVLKQSQKSSKEDWKVRINERVVSSLTLPLYENSATLLPLWFKASGGNERARILVLLIVLQLIGQARKEDIPHIVDATLTWLTNDWVSVGLEKVPSLQEPQQETDYNASGTASNVYRLLDTQPSLLLEKLLLMVLYKLLEIVPSNEEVCSFSVVHCKGYKIIFQFTSFYQEMVQGSIALVAHDLI
jgi:hypothetical protein